MAETAKKGGKTTENKDDNQFIALTQEQFNQLLKVASKPGDEKTEEDRKEEATLQSNFAKMNNKRDRDAKRFFERTMREKDKMRKIMIPKIYKDYAGDITSNVNGLTVKVPADGKTHVVHQMHYEAIQSKLRYLDENIARSSNQNYMFGHEKGDYGQVPN